MDPWVLFRRVGNGTDDGRDGQGPVIHGIINSLFIGLSVRKCRSVVAGQLWADGSE